MAREAGVKNEFEDDDLYEILEISPSATEDQIKEAYKKLARKHHPDKNNKNLKEAEEMMKRILNAHKNLIDPNLRRIYDLQRARKKRSGTSKKSQNANGEKKDDTNESSSSKDKNNFTDSKGNDRDRTAGPQGTGPASREEMERKIKELQRRMEEMERKDREWKMEKEELLNSRRQLQEDFKIAERERGSLKKDLEKIESERDELKIEKDKWKEQNTRTEIENDKLRQNNIRLEDEGNKMKTSIEEMKDERHTIITKMTADVKRTDVVHAENEKLRAEKEQYLRRLFQLSAAIETVKQQLNDSKDSLETEKTTNEELIKTVEQRQRELEEEKGKVGKMTEENMVLNEKLEHLINVELQKSREENQTLNSKINALEEMMQEKEENWARREMEVEAVLTQYQAQGELIKRLLDETNQQKLTIDEFKQRDQADYFKTIAEECQADKDKLKDELKTATDGYTRLLGFNKEHEKEIQAQIQNKRVLMKELRELKSRMERVRQTNENLERTNKGLLQELCEKDKQLMWFAFNNPFPSPGGDRQS